MWLKSRCFGVNLADGLSSEHRISADDGPPHSTRTCFVETLVHELTFPDLTSLPKRHAKSKTSFNEKLMLDDELSLSKKDSLSRVCVKRTIYRCHRGNGCEHTVCT